VSLISTRILHQQLLKFFSFFFQALILILVAPLQIDPHHDGIILGAAIGSSTGHIGPAGAFSQYGPLSPMIQGLFLKIFGNTMLDLRYFAALNALLISFLLFKIVSKFTEERIAILISSSWVLTSAIWSTTFPGALLAWPSMISTALILAAMYVLLRVLRKENLTKLSETACLFSAGILLGLTGFARQQTWIAAGIFLIILIVRHKGLFNVTLYYLFGVILALVGMFTWLGAIGSLKSYVDQVIIWPLTAYSTLGANNNYNRYQFASYVIQTLVFIFVVYFVSIIRKYLKSSKIRFVTTLAIGSIVAFNGFWIAKQSQWSATIRVMLGEPQEKLILSFNYFACLSCLGMITYFILKRRSLSELDSEKFALVFIGLSGVVQLYPQPDVLHLWWVSPIFLPSALFALELISERFKAIKFSDGLTVLSVFSLIGAILATSFIFQPWTEYELPVLKGTYAFESKVKAINTSVGIERFIKKGETSFDCADGIYAVSDGNYNAVDEWFVNWGMLKTESPKIGNIRIICSKGSVYANEEAKRLGMTLEYYVESENTNINYAVLVRK
jgi:hypothetical protein